MANGGYKTSFIERHSLISEMLKDEGCVLKMNKTEYYVPGSILAAKLFV